MPSLEVAGERVPGPAVVVHRHDVGVAHEHQRRRVGVAALDAGDEARPARLGLEALDVDAARAQVLLEQVDAAQLVARRRRCRR